MTKLADLECFLLKGWSLTNFLGLLSDVFACAFSSFIIEFKSIKNFLQTWLASGKTKYPNINHLMFYKTTKRGSSSTRQSKLDMVKSSVLRTVLELTAVRCAWTKREAVNMAVKFTKLTSNFWLSWTRLITQMRLRGLPVPIASVRNCLSLWSRIWETTKSNETRMKTNELYQFDRKD